MYSFVILIRFAVATVPTLRVGAICLLGCNSGTAIAPRATPNIKAI